MTSMDKLPPYVILQILSRLDDSADVARCRVAWKAFDTVSTFLTSINLKCTVKWYNSTSSPRVSLKKVFLDLISKLELVESVCIKFERHRVDPESDDFYIMDGDFAFKWLPRVSRSLRKLSLSGLNCHYHRQSNVFPLISAYCRSLVILKLKCATLSFDNLFGMPTLKSLTIQSTSLETEHVNNFSMFFPNLVILNLISISRLKDPNIHFPNLRCFTFVSYCSTSLTLTAPSLVYLRMEVPILTNLHLGTNKFENLTTLVVDSLYTGAILSQFPVTKTIEDVTLDTMDLGDEPRDPKLTLRRVFTLFPNVASLCVKSDVWLDFEECSNPEGWEIPNGRRGLKTFCAYVVLVDPSFTFSSVARVLDQCTGLSDVSLFIHRNMDDTVSKRFRIKCMARWPNMNWRWGAWREHEEDSWITDVHMDIHHKHRSYKRRCL